MTTILTAARYITLLGIVLFWIACLWLVCWFDRDMRLACKRGERIDHVDGAIDRLDKLHDEVFGSE